MYPDSLKQLIEAFKCLPGIGEKTAESIAFSILDMEEEQVEMFSDSIQHVFHNIKKCEKCNTFTENELCFACSDGSRNQKVLCVVEDTKSVFLIEKLGMFQGMYHVLDGLISPIDGVNPEDIGLGKLMERIHQENFEEIIFAFKPSIEGETTTLYIKSILSDMNLKFSKLASGIPIGADMEYVDSLTLEKALNDRIFLE